MPWLTAPCPWPFAPLQGELRGGRALGGPHARLERPPGKPAARPNALDGVPRTRPPRQLRPGTALLFFLHLLRPGQRHRHLYLPHVSPWGGFLGEPTRQRQSRASPTPPTPKRADASQIDREVKLEIVILPDCVSCFVQVKESANAVQHFRRESSDL